MKANLLLKHNIDTLLRKRGQHRKDLAQWCLRTTERRADTWISHIFGNKGYQTREIPTKYLDRIADFFGIATYQLFQPGISPLTERRSGRERRTGLDRRLSRAAHAGQPVHKPDLESVTPWERDFLNRLRRKRLGDVQWIASTLDRLPDRDAAQGTGGDGGPQPIVSLPPASTRRTRARRLKGNDGRRAGSDQA